MKIISFLMWLILLLFIITNLKMCSEGEWKENLKEEITDITEFPENSTFFN